jgi:hypothetical protein
MSAFVNHCPLFGSSFVLCAFILVHPREALHCTALRSSCCPCLWRNLWPFLAFSSVSLLGSFFARSAGCVTKPSWCHVAFAFYFVLGGIWGGYRLGAVHTAHCTLHTAHCTLHKRQKGLMGPNCVGGTLIIYHLATLVQDVTECVTWAHCIPQKAARFFVPFSRSLAECLSVLLFE